MNILFTLLKLAKDLKSSGMYMDLAQEFVKNGHQVTIICGTDEPTTFKEEYGMRVGIQQVSRKRTIRLDCDAYAPYYHD